MTRQSCAHLLALLAVATGPLAAQAPARSDVELLGEVHGTRPPAAFYERLARDPDAFTFARAWKGRNPSLRRAQPAQPDGRPRFEVVGPARADGSSGGPAALGPRDGPVTGTIRVPLVLGLFSDSPPVPPFGADEIQREFFDGPNSRGATITDYYDEVSGGRVELLGETQAWKRATLTEEQVTDGVSGLGGQIGTYVVQIISQYQTVDWGRYDNDGPDGVPNSGDDDGYVDVLAIMHPNFGAECGGSGRDDRIWSHKWNLRAARGNAYTTNVERPGGGRIRIDDYTVQPVYACPATTPPTEINEIGVLAHELGHGFGLPDLYDTQDQDGSHNGIGGWGLMGSGSWGCSQGTPEEPCHMSAWSKEQLGWAEVVTLPAGADLGRYVFEPVETRGRVYRMDSLDGSGEYYLLENRQALGFDSAVPRPGLLVWHIDAARVAQRWPSNTVNGADRMGVFLVQADGLNNLGQRGGGNRGDGGDPFPGSSNNTRFHAASRPASETWAGDATGLTLTDLALEGENVSADVLTRLQRVTLEATSESPIEVAFAVDGQAVSSSSFEAAPYQTVEIEAGAGPAVSEGVRVGFEGWVDDPDLPRVRVFQTPTNDVTLSARYGGEEVRGRLTLEGSEFGVPAGVVEMDPAPHEEADGLWFPRGAAVSFRAVPNTGYDFTGWSGPLAGMANPATLQVDDPFDFGAVFALTYAAVGAHHTFEAARQQTIVLVAENASPPVRWTPLGGTGLPLGLTFSPDGFINGAALQTGSFTLTVRARDASGLEATAELELEVIEPTLGVGALAAQFIGTSGTLSTAERAFLDLRGNADGTYDLGDFRAWVLEHPDLPATVEERALVRTLVPTVRFQPGGGR